LTTLLPLRVVALTINEVVVEADELFNEIQVGFGGGLVEVEKVYQKTFVERPE
jgi:hypothetical protein